MEIFREIAPLRAFLQEKRLTSISIGLVPTMGALHNGHLALISASKAENDLSIATIYVNPTQFNNSSDLDKYPRTQEHDIQLLEREGCDIAFIPSDSEMYASGKALKFDFGDLDKIMEGKFRPGHFSGVALVVSKLFNIVQPDKAYFGQKDYQQLQIISRLTEELKFNTTIRTVPIVREPTGLAMSSRNQRLSDEEKKMATLLFESLSHAKEGLARGITFGEIRQEVETRFKNNRKLKLEYFELAHKQTLLPIDSVDQRDGILLIAAFVNDVRLIDNLLLKDEYEN